MWLVCHADLHGGSHSPFCPVAKASWTSDFTHWKALPRTLLASPYFWAPIFLLHPNLTILPHFTSNQNESLLLPGVPRDGNAQSMAWGAKLSGIDLALPVFPLMTSVKSLNFSSCGFFISAVAKVKWVSSSQGFGIMPDKQRAVNKWQLMSHCTLPAPPPLGTGLKFILWHILQLSPDWLT